jgi:hypothetical protein
LLECLPKCDEILRWINALYGIYIMAKIDADRTDRSRITQTNANGIGVVRHEVVEIDGAVNIAAVVKNNSSQMFADVERKRKANLGIQDEQLRSAHRHRDVHASRLILQHVAKRYDALRSGFIDRKSSQRGATA